MSELISCDYCYGLHRTREEVDRCGTQANKPLSELALCDGSRLAEGLRLLLKALGIRIN